jgi:hypothetical protein
MGCRRWFSGPQSRHPTASNPYQVRLKVGPPSWSSLPDPVVGAMPLIAAPDQCPFDYSCKRDSVFTDAVFIGICLKRYFLGQVKAWKNAMTAFSKLADPWSRTVHQLEAMPADIARTAPSQRAARIGTDLIERLTRDWNRTHPHPRPSNERLPYPAAIVRVIERPSSATALVYWSDPGICHYGYQGWRATTSTAEGICSLSGMPIHRGDQVYRPSQRDPKPQNAAAMILATAMPSDSEEMEVDLHD